MGAAIRTPRQPGAVTGLVPCLFRRPPQCVLAVHRALAQRPMHDLGDGRVVVPLLDPAADDLPFAVALELHRRGEAGHCSNPAVTGSDSDSFQLHYVLQGAAEVGMHGPVAPASTHVRIFGQVQAASDPTMKRLHACKD